MTETVPIVAFLEARYRETENGAHEAATDAGMHWSELWSGVVETADDTIACGDARLSRHIVDHDPARVLADVAAKRAILAEHTPTDVIDVYRQDGSPMSRQACSVCVEYFYDEDPGGNMTRNREHADYPCLTVRALALEFGDHPDHSSAWGLETR